jgi:hypothetical protein
MPSKLQQETSRQNGAKSHGPVTPEGKAQSSKNAVKHGLTAAVVVLPHENKEEFNKLLHSYVHDFRPANQSQQDLVETLAATRWRLNRLVSLETHLFEQETIRNKQTIEKEFTGMDDAGKLAWTLNKMVNTSKTPAHLLRYESQLNRTYERALKQLKELQSMQSVQPALAKPSRDSNGAVISNTPKEIPQSPKEPGEPESSPLHPPEAPPSDPQNREEGDEILAA